MARKLLLADDNLTVQRVVELTFAEEGIEVVSVGDGVEAVRRATEEAPDVVLADVSMPGLDGYQVAERVKSNPRLAHVRVVLMTGAFEPLDEARAAAVHCDAVLAKPFEPHMVTALVRQLLDGEAQARSAWPAARPATPVPPPDPGEVSTASLDEYLEQLDESLTVSGGPRPPAVPGAVAPGAGTMPVIDAEPGAAPPAVPASLADAFSALLADELGEAPPQTAWGRFAGRGAGPGRQPAPPAEPVVTDALLDEIARRVAERLGEAAVREVVREVVRAEVLDVAERLVREEIARIKAHA